MVFSLNILYSQTYENQEQVSTFFSKAKKPINVEVVRIGQELSFFGTNNSYFSYNFELQFTTLANVSPQMQRHSQVLLPGRSRLFSLKIFEESNPSYSYQIKFVINGTNDASDPNFIYLIPLAKKSVIQQNMATAGSIGFFHPIVAKDTVFASRKGKVIGTYEIAEGDIISQTSILEVLHDDETVASYATFAPKNVEMLTDIGKTVYPGQPLFITKEEMQVIFRVFQITKESKVKRLPIKFFILEGKHLSTNEIIKGVVVSHPTKLITQELTKREIKKYKSNSLYQNNER
ncbi:MAG: hypothetical protein ACJAS3_001473 [Roseivirga sp.]|jgi:hypothetical protein